ncbi:TIR domain-containing protein [Dethiobacter alkaliphilus]|uniref:TIR domain-containing protein n=1 Tax=Dethiobacter alkaliphilus TaxID=427926 RepID=UPI002225B81B|nr:TIR domain-containing protein [Dethiobacter alkaliphilus]MCW3491537.1 TIR domain-containing protein [Dethiobacter alkaliphilus]
MTELYNLLISGIEGSWETGSTIFPLDRCINEYTEKDLVEKFSQLGQSEINELKKIPCIFAYEDGHKKDASVGYIKDVIVRQTRVKIIYEKIAILPFDDFHRIQFDLDIEDWEFNRTHWAIKKVNLFEILESIGINYTHINSSKNIDIAKHDFDVSFTFAGESRDVVEQVVKALEKLINKNNIFYDNYYVSQLARPSLDSLLQDIYRNRSKLIVVFLSGEYQDKEWCGLEFRVVQEIIMQKDYKKIMYIRLDDGPVNGVLKLDGYVNGLKFSPQELAEFIYERLNLLL